MRGLEAVNAPAAGGLLPPASYAGRPYSLWPMPGLGLGNVGCGTIVDTAATALTMVGMGPGSINGTPSAPGALTGATRNYIQWASGATSGNVCGPAKTTGMLIRASAGFYFTGVWRCAEVAALRLWFTITSSALQSTAVPTTSTPLAVNFAGIGWDTAVDAHFICASGDGTNLSGTTTSYTPVTQHEYVLVLDGWTEPASAINYYVYDLTAGTTVVSVRKTTNLPGTSGSTTMGWGVTITTTENVAKNLQLNSVGLASRW